MCIKWYNILKFKMLLPTGILQRLEKKGSFNALKKFVLNTLLLNKLVSF